MRGHYFAICTLGLGIAGGEIAGGIEIIGAGQGFNDLLNAGTAIANLGFTNNLFDTNKQMKLFI